MKENKINEEISLRSSESLSEKGMLSPEIRKFLLEANRTPIIVNGQKREFSIHALRIILILSLNLKEKQMKFRDKHRNQLSLFDEEWFDVSNDKLMSVQVNFKYSDFLPRRSQRNTHYIREGLFELQDRPYLLEFEKKTNTGAIKKFRLRSALISQFLEEEGKGFKMVINNYWYRALLNVSDYYTPMIKESIFTLSQNALLFYIYINGLPQIKYQKDSERYSSIKKEFNIENLPLLRGTIISKDNFQKIFNANYKYDSHIQNKLLIPIQKEFSKTKMDKNFNYKFEKGNIVIVVYEMLSTQIAMNLRDKDETDIEKAITYRFKEKELTPLQALLLCEIFLKYTYDVVMKATSRKSSIRGVKGEKFLKEFKNLVEQYVTKNGIDIETIKYPNQNEMRLKLSKKYYNSIEKGDNQAL